MLRMIDSFDCGLSKNATNEDKRSFADIRLRSYRWHTQWRQETLLKYFADDFRPFTVDDFKMISSDQRRNLRDLLCERGVYVPKGRNVFIADALHMVVQEDLPWPEEKLQHVIETETPSTKHPNQNAQEGPASSQQDEPTHDAEAKLPEKNEKPTPCVNMGNLFKAYSKEEDCYSDRTTVNFE